MLLKKPSQRGQMLPFWALGIVAMLALTFFTANYTNMLRWGVRAQSAADSAASAGISTDANEFNEINTLLYAATVEEMRMRYLLQGIVNTVVDPAACGANCDATYAALVAAYTQAAQDYKTIMQQPLQEADNLTKGGLQNSPDKAIGLASDNCTILDCAFTYNFTLNAQNEIVDVVTCKANTAFVPGILGLATGTTFKAVGRSAASMAAVTQTVTLDSLKDTSGNPLQPPEYPASALVGTSPVFGVDFSTLTVGLSWWVAGPTHPDPYTGTYQCS